jgi:hypothetical protein
VARALVPARATIIGGGGAGGHHAANAFRSRANLLQTARSGDACLFQILEQIRIPHGLAKLREKRFEFTEYDDVFAGRGFEQIGVNGPAHHKRRGHFPI